MLEKEPSKTQNKSPKSPNPPRNQKKIRIFIVVISDNFLTLRKLGTAVILAVSKITSTHIIFSG